MVGGVGSTNDGEILGVEIGEERGAAGGAEEGRDVDLPVREDG